MPCPFCGTVSVPPPEVVAVGRVAKPMGHETAPDARLPCPRCAAFLVEKRARDTVLSGCRSCGGIWLDAATVARLRSARDEEIDAAARRIKPDFVGSQGPDRAAPIACPVCRQSLRRTSIPGTSHVVDVCDAHGTWFDRAEADELEVFVHAFEALRAGEAIPEAGPPRGLFAKLFGRS